MAIDKALIQRCLQADETAWRWLIEQYKERLFRVALGFLGDETEAEEATQETFVRMFRYLDQFHGGSSLYTWACRICINLCLRSRQRTSRHREREVSLDEIEVRDFVTAVAGPATPEDKLLQQELVQYIHQELRHLPKEYQTVLILRELDELSYKEIAHVLGISVGTVKSRVHRGRLLLKERLSSYIDGVKHAS